MSSSSLSMEANEESKMRSPRPRRTTAKHSSSETHHHSQEGGGESSSSQPPLRRSTAVKPRSRRSSVSPQPRKAKQPPSVLEEEEVSWERSPPQRPKKSTSPAVIRSGKSSSSQRRSRNSSPTSSESSPNRRRGPSPKQQPQYQSRSSRRGRSPTLSSSTSASMTHTNPSRNRDRKQSPSSSMMPRKPTRSKSPKLLNDEEQAKVNQLLDLASPPVVNSVKSRPILDPPPPLEMASPLSRRRPSDTTTPSRARPTVRRTSSLLTTRPRRKEMDPSDDHGNNNNNNHPNENEDDHDGEVPKPSRSSGRPTRRRKSGSHVSQLLPVDAESTEVKSNPRAATVRRGVTRRKSGNPLALFRQSPPPPPQDSHNNNNNNEEQETNATATDTTTPGTTSSKQTWEEAKKKNATVSIRRGVQRRKSGSHLPQLLDAVASPRRRTHSVEHINDDNDSAWNDANPKTKARPPRPPRRTIMAGATLYVRLLRAKDMLQQKQSLLSSPSLYPYAMIYLFDLGWKLYGQTGTVHMHSKNPNPVWNETIHIELGCDAARGLIRSGERLEVRLFDHNPVLDDDFLGSASIPVWHTAQEQWVRLARRSPNDNSLQAKTVTNGYVQVRVHLEPYELLDVYVGDVLTLPSPDVTVGLAWKVDAEMQKRNLIVAETSCVALDESGEILWNETVCRGHESNSNRSLSLERIVPNTTLTYYHHDNCAIHFQVDRIPFYVSVWYIILHLNVPFDQLQGFEARCLQTSTKIGWCRFRPLILQSSQSVLLLRLNRHRRKGTHVQVTPVDQYVTAPDFGCLIPHMKQLSRDILTRPVTVHLNERVAVLKLDRPVPVSDYTASPQLALHVSWRQRDPKHTLDVVAILLDSSYRKVASVWQEEPDTRDGSVTYGADPCRPEEEYKLDKDAAYAKTSILYNDSQSPTGQWFDLNLDSVSVRTKYICFGISPYSISNGGEHTTSETDLVTQAACHWYDSRTGLLVGNSGPTLLSTPAPALLLAYLVRSNYDEEVDGSYGDGWQLKLVQEMARGTTIPHSVTEWAAYLQYTEQEHRGTVTVPSLPTEEYIQDLTLPELVEVDLERKVIRDDVIFNYL